MRSIAHALALAPDTSDIEFQVLRGLGDDLQAALAGMGLRVRTYCPVGDLVAGMSYLVRRLLENTSNDSFLLSRSRGAGPRLAARRAVNNFINEPLLELRRAPVRETLVDALAALDAQLPWRVPVIVGRRPPRRAHA